MSYNQKILPDATSLLSHFGQIFCDSFLFCKMKGIDSIYILTILIGSNFNWVGASYLLLVSGNVTVNCFKKYTLPCLPKFLPLMGAGELKVEIQKQPGSQRCCWKKNLPDLF